MMLAAALIPVMAPAPAQHAPGLGSVIERVEHLKPGEYIWAPQIAPKGPVLLIVNRATQRLVVYRNGIPIGISTISTGREGYSTPVGVFTILEKQIEHYSTTYDNAPMPYMQRLTWRGVALHGGSLPGYPASHGCIRLPTAFARLLYEITDLGATVIVADRPAVPRVAPSLGLTDDQIGDGTIEWHPERSPSGPVSIIISQRDRRVLVLRNGRVIGAAPVSIGEQIEGTRAYVLRAVDQEGSHWFSIPLSELAGAERPARGFAKPFGVDADFRREVAAIVAPGTTIVVTPDSLRMPAEPTVLIEDAP